MKPTLPFAQKATLLLAFVLGTSGASMGQGPMGGSSWYQNCEPFDSEWSPFAYTFSSDSTWQIGQPTKAGFDSSYSGNFSIITSLDTHYKNNDTAVFYARKHENFYVFFDSGFYVGVEFYHRFKTDSTSDYGTLHLSVDSGLHWLDLFSTENDDSAVYTGFAQNHHFIELDSTGHEPLLIHGNSNGWVHSRIYKQFSHPTLVDEFFSDDLILKFTFISDSAGTDAGWQIDDLCVGVEHPQGIDEKSAPAIAITPNPATDKLHIAAADAIAQVAVHDISGQKLLEVAGQNCPSLEIDIGMLPAGLYFVSISTAGDTAVQKVVKR